MNGNDSSTTLSAKQQTMIAAMLAGNTVQVAAKAAGISEATAYRWQKLPQVQQALKDAQKEVFQHTIDRLITLAGTAIDTLNTSMTNDETPANTRVRAAQILLEQAISLHKLDEVERQLEELKILLDRK